MSMVSVTGNDIVKALTESGMLDREIDSVKGGMGDSIVLIFEDSSEYIDEDAVLFNDTHLIVTGNKWRLEQNKWVG